MTIITRPTHGHRRTATFLGFSDLTRAPAAEGGTADPTQLPLATAQAPSWGYLSGMSPGDSVSAPVSGVTVFKVTDSSTPNTGHSGDRNVHSSGAHGPYISRAWSSGGKTYYTLAFMAPQTPTGAQDVWYVDLNHTDAVATPAQNPFGNYRKHGSPLAGGDGQDALAFSYRAADDARTVYSGADGVFRKWDISTDPPTEITTGNWPFDTGETRLHIVTSQDGPWITGTVYQYQDVWFWNQDTNASCEITKVAEPDAGGGFIDRGAAYGFIEVDDTVAGDVEVRRWVANCTFNGRSTRHQSHSDICKGFALMTDPQTGNKLWRLEMATNTETDVGSDGEVVDSPGYFAQQWIEGVSGISQLWALFSADATPNDGKIQYGIIMIPFDYPTRACRFFAHTDTRNTSDFYARSHATMSPDGKVVMWNSDMNNQGGRVDVFCALMPTS